jgi:hypothetical protein
MTEAFLGGAFLAFSVASFFVVKVVAFALLDRGLNL